MRLSNELEVTLPDGFRVMEDSERDKLQMIADGPGFCAENKEAHIMFSAGWKKIRTFAGIILNLNDVTKQMEKSIRAAMEPFGCRDVKKEERVIAEYPARGISFRYTAADGTEMYSTSLAAKKGSTIYYFHYYTRWELVKENQDVYEKLLGGVKRV